LGNITLAQYRQRMYFGYLQDDFKVSRPDTQSRLRYEYATPQWERDSIELRSATNSLVKAPGGSIYGRTVQPDRNNFAPGSALQRNTEAVLPAANLRAFNRLGRNLLAMAVLRPGDHIATDLAAALHARRSFTTTSGPPDGYPIGLTDRRTSTRPSPRASDPATPFPRAELALHHPARAAHDLVLDVAYVGNRGNKLLILGDYSQAR
jgi:hypothetical protein